MAKNSKLVYIAKHLRRKMTQTEEILWRELRNNKLGTKFRRQMPLCIGIYNFIADFYCAGYKLIVEIDGGIHDLPENRECDKLRDDLLTFSGYKILRIKNKEVYDSIDKIIDKIKNYLK